MERACGLPDAPSVFHSNLAEFYRQGRRYQEGEATARRAVAMDAANARGWNALGTILQEVGRLDEAREALERACTLAPDIAEIHNNLANAAASLGDYDVAIAATERALVLNPELSEARGIRARALLERTRALLKAERAEAAVESGRRAAEANPTNAEALLLLGQALQAIGRDDEALAVYERARDLQPDRPAVALFHSGALLLELGRLDEARATVANALSQEPPLPSAWALHAQLKTFSVGDSDLEAMESILRTIPEEDVSGRTLLHFALGKAFLETSDGDRAFAHFNAGNRLQRATFDYDVDAVTAWFDDIARAFPVEIFGRFEGSGALSDRPIFVVGMPRSGTTLIEQILASHPDVHGAGELTVLPAIVDRIRAPDGSVLSYTQFVAALRPADVAMLGSAYLEKIAPLAPEKRRVVDKLPANFVHAGLIALTLPGARIIHVRRDPVDTCLSCYTTWFRNPQPFAYDLSELGRFYRGYERLMEHWTAVLPANRHTTVRYEDVVDDLEGQARRLVAFCGLPWDDACLSFHRSRRRVQTASAAQVRQPIHRRSVGRWRAHASHLAPLLETLDV